MMKHEYDSEDTCKACGIRVGNVYPSGRPGLGDECPSKIEVLQWLRDVALVLFEDCPHEDYWRFSLRPGRDTLDLPYNLAQEIARWGEIRWHG
jgi:hypothetical protein